MDLLLLVAPTICGFRLRAGSWITGRMWGSRVEFGSSAHLVRGALGLGLRLF